MGQEELELLQLRQLESIDRRLQHLEDLLEEELCLLRQSTPKYAAPGPVAFKAA
jgi:hypothetical protein